MEVLLFSGRIDNCFDSHVHWHATGEFADRLDLHALKDADGVRELKPSDSHWRGDWLVGFGWDQNRWTNREFPHRKILDSAFDPKRPVCFSRADGHAVWVNTEALKRFGLLNDAGDLAAEISQTSGGKIITDDRGLPTGVLVDVPAFEMLKRIPQPTASQIRRHLFKAMQMFNRVGFTHIRDMTCNSAQWNEAVHLENSGVLTLAVEQFFDAEDPKFFDLALSTALEAKKDSTQLLKVKGVKLFFDGALGSEGAFISHPYSSGSGQGLQLLTPEILRECLRRTWESGLELAVHVIGDEAAHQTVQVVRELHDSDVKGTVHLEHVEMLRTQTLQLMEGLDIHCHMQPCHWLSDHAWLEQKLGSLSEVAFPWRALQEAGVPFDFGSDSPIEAPSVAANLKALEESAVAGVPKLLGDPLVYHSHRERGWVANSYTVFENGAAVQVVFNGQHLF